MLFWFLLNLFFAQAVNPQLKNCTLEAIKKGRREVAPVSNASQLKVINAKLDTLCPVGLDDKGELSEKLLAEWYEYKNELFVALNRSKSFSECLKLGIELQKKYFHNPFSKRGFEKKAIGKSIVKNVGLCEKGRLSGLEKQKSNQLSSKIVFYYQDASGATNFVETENPVEKTKNVSGVFAKTTKETIRMDADKGVATERDFCSQLIPTLYKKNKNQFVLRLTGFSTSCSGGNASNQVDTLYEIKNKKLVLLDEVFVPLY